MKRDLVQLWVTRGTRQAVKVLAATNGITVVDYLESIFKLPTEDGMPLVTIAEKSPSV